VCGQIVALRTTFRCHCHPPSFRPPTAITKGAQLALFRPTQQRRILQAPDLVKPLVIGRQVLAEQNRVGAEVDRAQRHRAAGIPRGGAAAGVNPGEFPDALGALDHVSTEVCRKNRAVGTLRTAKLLTRRHLDRRFSGDVCDEKVERNVLAVHVIVHPRLYVARHRVRVQKVVVLESHNTTTTTNYNNLLFHITYATLLVAWLSGYGFSLWPVEFPRYSPDMWSICDHFLGKVSAMGQPTRPTQPSIPTGSVNE